MKKGEREGIKREAVLPLKVLSREDYLTASVLSTLTFVVYAFTAAPGVTLADSADFIMGVLTLGICVRQERSSHPCHENTEKSRLAIVDIYMSQENWPKVTEISRKILECDPGHKIAERYLEMAVQRTE